MPNPRPQRLDAWFNLIPVKEFEQNRPQRILFLDSFATVEPINDGGTPAYRVLFEGTREMTVVVHVGVIFVWYGDDLASPDRPFPTFFSELYDSQYVTSAPSLFEHTHVMDFVENGSDNLHFKAVHLWDYSKMYDHVITDETITLKQDTRFQYGKCSTKRSIRLLSKVLPELELTQDYVYHGPTLAVVGATGAASPEMHALVSLTPEGEHRTRVYVTMALAPSTFPAWAERAFGRLSPKRALRDLLAGVMANFIQNEFDIDAIIWSNRKHMPQPGLLPSEKHLQDVIEWGKTFYPKEFQAEEVRPRAQEDKRWMDLDAVDNITPGKVHRYSIAGEELIARRNARGNLQVFDAFCPHQGAHLGHGGRLDDDCLRCPFHGFYFDSDGRCIGPNLNNRGKFIETLNLTAIEHRIRDDRAEVLV